MMRLEKLYAGLMAAIFGLIVIHAPLTVWLGVTFPDISELIKSWKEILMLLTLPVALTIVGRKKLWPIVVKDPLFYCITSYAFLHIVATWVLFEGTIPTLVGLAVDLRYLLFFSLVYVLLLAYPAYRRLFIRIGIGGATIVVGFATLQWFLPADILTTIGYSKNTIEPYLTVDKNPDYIRVNSTLRGPNPLGAYTSIVAAVLLAAWLKGMIMIHRYKVYAGILTICSVVALWISYSRSALIAVAVGLVVVFAATYGRKLSKNAWIGMAVAICILMGGFVAARDSVLVSNVILHENPDGGSVVSSNDQHAESITIGIERMISQPFGAGVGSTGSASLYGSNPIIIENQYLFIAHEVGWLGLVLFISLFILVLRRLWRLRSDWLALGVFASGVGLGIIGLLQPVWVDDTVSIVWWGLAAIAITGGDYGRATAKQKTTRAT